MNSHRLSKMFSRFASLYTKSLMIIVIYSLISNTLPHPNMWRLVRKRLSQWRGPRIQTTLTFDPVKTGNLHLLGKITLFSVSSKLTSIMSNWFSGLFVKGNSVQIPGHLVHRSLRTVNEVHRPRTDGWDFHIRFCTQITRVPFGVNGETGCTPVYPSFAQSVYNSGHGLLLLA